MLFDKLIHEEWFLYYVTHFVPFESCQTLLCTLKDIQIPDCGWKDLCYRDFPKVNFAALQLNKPFETYCICQNIGNYCVICKNKLWNDNYVGEHYLLMCNCLKTTSYCFAHKNCLTMCPSRNNCLPNVSTQETFPTHQRRKTLVTLKCNFCKQIQIPL